MQFITQRIIQYLKSDSTLVDLLGDSKAIMARGINHDRFKYYVLVALEPGMDLNYAPAQKGKIEIEFGASRVEANAFSTLVDIVSRVDDLLNRGEPNLSNVDWKVLNFIRAESPTEGMQVDSDKNEYYMILEYDYILQDGS